VASPNAPLVYWLRPRFFQLLCSPRRLSNMAEVRVGLKTSDDGRFVRCFWEVPSFGVVCEGNATSGRWFWFAKGGGYRKWAGLEWLVVDWEDHGRRLKTWIDPHHGRPYSNVWMLRVTEERYFFHRGLTYTQMARGSLGVRMMRESIFGHKGNSIFSSPETGMALCALLNSRVASYLARAIAQQLGFEAGHVLALPVPGSGLETLSEAGFKCHSLKQELVVHDPTEGCFCRTIEDADPAWRIAAVLHWLEGSIDASVCRLLALDAEAVRAVVDETGVPAGWGRLIAGYDCLEALATALGTVPPALEGSLARQQRAHLTQAELKRLKQRLRALYLAGPGAAVEEDEDSGTEHDTVDAELALGGHIPIPSETFLEELSLTLRVHPITVYWLLEELRREDGLVCPPELQHHTEDYFSVKLLRMLGFRWPMQDQYERVQGHPFLDPRWIDTDGLIPLTSGAGEQTLVERMRRYLDAEFGSERGPDVERRAGTVLGWSRGDEWGKQKATSLETWFEREFFKRHVSQFKHRPIAWHLRSPRGAFQSIVYYHKFDKDRLALLRARYVRGLLDRRRQQLAEAQAHGLIDRQALKRAEDLEAEVADLLDFDARLRRLQEGREREARIWCPWKKSEEQPAGWDPDINDGVRVNIAPLQRLGLLATDVLNKKDMQSLLAPEGRS
jgi:hypothetical protein